MTKRQIDLYLAKVPEPQRGTLKELRTLIRTALPEAEECISYNMPAYKVKGRVIAGFASAKNHCSYYPFSGATLTTLSAEVSNYVTTKGSLHFAIDRCIPASLVNKLIKARLKEVEAKQNGRS